MRCSTVLDSRLALGRRGVLRLMVLGLVGVMTLTGSAPALAGTQDADSFWTQFTPSPDTRLIFVSNSEGSDSNSGLTPAQPVKSIARGYALLRDGAPDWLLLKRGDTWIESVPNWTKSGRSSDERMVLGAYGDGQDRPQVRPTAGATGMNAVGNARTEHVAFVGFHLEPHVRSDDQGPSGIRWLRPATDVLFEDVYVAGFANNVTLQAYGDGVILQDFRLNGCVIVDSWSRQGHSQGLYASGTQGLVVENSVFASNGFNADRGASPTVFNHNLYIASNNSPVVVRSNIIADASSHGVQLRPGGEILDNLFLSNPISILLGSNLPTTHPVAGGVAGVVRGNVVMYGRSITDSLPRAWGIDITNVRQARITGNILYSSVIGYNGEAIRLGDGLAYGVSDTLVEGNHLVDWNGTLSIGGPGASQVFSDVVIRGNRIWRDLHANAGNTNFNKPFVSIFSSSHPELSITSNAYFFKGMHDRPFLAAGVPLSADDWRTNVEPTGSFEPVSEMPAIGLDGYMSFIGQPGGWQDFVLHARSQSRTQLDSRFRPDAVQDWIATQLGAN